jgi:hypothetical protein
LLLYVGSDVCAVLCVAAALLAGVRKAPSLGDDEEPVDPVVEANLRAMYKAWYGQKESDFWAGYAQLVGSTSLPLDGQVGEGGVWVGGRRRQQRWLISIGCT